MPWIQIDERTWMIPMRRSAITGRYIPRSETIESILKRLEGYYREDD